MPSKKRRIDAADLFASVDGELILFCERLIELNERDPGAFDSEIAKANRVLSKHETGFVLGFLAACLEPIA